MTYVLNTNSENSSSSSIKNRLLPRVSVIIVNYNGYSWLKLFLQYVIRSNYPNLEIIVVDNASMDQSVPYLKENFKQIKVLELANNTGFAEGTNIGARAASGEILAFLNNDIEVTENWLFEAVSHLLESDTVVAVQSKMMQYYDKNKIEAIGISVDRFGILRAIGNNEEDFGQYNELKEIGAASGGAMILWRHIFYEVGCFDPLYFMYYEDIDLSWRIRIAGYKILPCPSSVVYHVGSGTSKKSSWAFITFHWTKNHLSCWLKNSNRKTIALCWPGIAFYIFGEMLFSAINRQPEIAYSHLRAIFWSINHIRYILKERRKVNAIRKERDGTDDILYIEGIFKDSNNLSYFMRKAIRSLRKHRS